MNKMNTMPCATIQDLLSLYINGELSEESRKLVAAHLETCHECKKAYEEIKESSKPISLYELKESMPETTTFKSWMKRLNRSAALGLLIILAVIASTGYLITFWLADTIQDAPVSPVIKVNSKAELQAYLYKKIPGLKRAESIGHVNYPAQTVNVPELDVDMRLETVWYSGNLVYVIYSVGDVVPDRADATLHWVDDDMKVQNQYENMSAGEGVLYDGRFYSIFLFEFENVKEDRLPSSEKTKLRLALDTTLTVNEQKIKIEKIQMTADYDPTWEKPLYLAMESELPLLEGKIKLKGLELTPNKSYLYVDFDHPEGKQIYQFDGYVTSGNGDSRRIWLPLEPGNDKARYRARFNAMDTVPNKITLKIKQAVLVGDEKFNFTIDATKYRYKDGMDMREQKLNRHIKTMVNTDISLERIVWDDRGIRFGLLYEHKKGLKPPYAVLTTDGIRLKEEAEHFRQKDWPFYNLVTAHNEKGEPAEYGSRGNGPQERMGMFLEREFTEKSKTIYVQVENLAYQLVGKWELEVPIKP